MAVIYTGPVLVPILTALAKEIMPGIRVRNVVDDSLLAECLEAGGMTGDVSRRILGYALHAEHYGADCVLISCSSVGAVVDLVRPLLSIPVIRIDEPMADEAVSRGTRIALVATVPTTLEPSENLIREKAAVARRRVAVDRFLCDRAFSALLDGDVRTHNRLLLDTITDAASSHDVVVLAQGSMVNILPDLPPGTRERVLTSPRMGMDRARKVLEAIREA